MKRIFLVVAALAILFSGCPNELELVAINVKANKVSYTVSESVAPSDIEVVATYRDGTSKVVTNYTVAPATFSEVGTTSVQVSYSENGVTKTASYEVIVNAPMPLTPPTPETFTVRFYANNDGATGNMEAQTFTEGQEQALATCGFSLNGYNFLGWAKAADAVDKEFDDEEIILVTEDMELYAVWEYAYVEFGLWPRTIKDPAVTVDKNTSDSQEVGMFTYYKGSDGKWYCEALENAYDPGAQYKYSNNEQVKRKSANSYQWFKVEPIKWRVLTDNYSGNKLLFAEEGLYASIAYYDDTNDTNDRTIDGKTIFSSNYKHSKIRAWLNGLSYNESGSENNDYFNKGFLQTAFSSEEIKKIVTVEVDNSEESTNPNSNPKKWNNGTNAYACEPTQDKIFLLSIKEASNSDYGFAEWDESGVGNARIRKPTDFALANYGWLSPTAGEGGWYFLRSPYYSGIHNARHVNSEGDLHYGGGRVSGDYYIFNEGLLVVPALVIAP